MKVRAEKCVEIWCEWAWKAVCHQKQVETPSMFAQQLVAVPERQLRNVHDAMADGTTAHGKRRCVLFEGPVIPCGATIVYRPITSMADCECAGHCELITDVESKRKSRDKSQHTTSGEHDFPCADDYFGMNNSRDLSLSALP